MRFEIYWLNSKFINEQTGNYLSMITHSCISLNSCIDLAGSIHSNNNDFIKHLHLPCLGMSILILIPPTAHSLPSSLLLLHPSIHPTFWSHTDFEIDAVWINRVGDKSQNVAICGISKSFGGLSIQSNPWFMSPIRRYSNMQTVLSYLSIV